MAQSEAPSPDTSASAEARGASAQGAASHGSLAALMVGAVGVVYGDIGTSPLYAFRESMAHVARNGADRGEVLGIVSLVFWAIMIVVTLKYVVIVMQMDNKGEGGTLSLMALAQRALGRRTPWLFVIGVVGASLFYGDAIITPAISVLSAVEGLEQVPALERIGIGNFVLPIGVGILIGLFVIQSRGTGRIGRYFGPVTILWFVVMAALGLWHLKDDWSILEALLPGHAIGFALQHGFLSFMVLGSVFLAVTGAEALYADMGHFGRMPIRLAWIGILAALTLNYLGQGAYTLHNLDAVNAMFARDVAEAEAAGIEHPASWTFSPFFAMAPDMLRLPVVVLATVATVIASQAVISGAYSLTQQAIQLGLFPRMEIRRTSETQYGQIYLPQVNWLLLAGVLVLTISFGSSTALAAAYGISITGEMMMSTLMMSVVVWKLWNRPLWMVIALAAPFLFIEIIFFSSNMLKLMSGGYVPILLATALVTVMWTWVRGTRLLAEQTRRDESLVRLLGTLSHHPPHKVRGTAIFLTGDPEVAPAALMHNLKHNQVLHETIIVLTVKTLQTPRAPDSERVKIEELAPDVKRVTLTFGFMETPNVVKALTASRKYGLKFDIMKTSFFLSRRTVIPSEKSGMPKWQDHLFIFLARNATNATDFFHIPSGRAVELGNQVMV
jgi:KUP system potassium uptake protein